MAIDEGRQVQRTSSANERDSSREPEARNADPEARTQRQIALVVSITFSLIALLVVIGGLAGRFDQTLVDVVFTALATAAGTVWVAVFRRSKAGGE